MTIIRTTPRTALPVPAAIIPDRVRRSTKRRPVWTTDADGNPIVQVYLDAEQTGFATVDAADFQALMELGVSPTWFLNVSGRGVSYVRTTFPRPTGKGHRVITVARLIMSAGPRETVKYADGNPKNLRRSNLYLTTGHGKHDSVAMVRQAVWQDPEVILPHVD